ncbi:MAG: glycogen debranching protein GlgX [Pseudorhodobacter sp.]
MTQSRDVPPAHLPQFALHEGSAQLLGASADAGGVNFALFSAAATQVDLCLFSKDGKREEARIPMPGRDGDIWSARLEGLTPGARYGYRVHGPYAPELGQRFNPNKLLIDPYARCFDGALRWSDALMGYKVGAAKADLSFDPRDSASFVPKSVVTEALPPAGRGPGHAWSDTVIYEAHAKGLTMQHPRIPEGLRGRYLGLCAAPMLDHLTRLGVTAIELLPVQSFIDDRFLVSRGLRNFWGYQTLGFFAPDLRYASQSAQAEFRQMVAAFHDAGIEVILDVVYNHSGEGDELGPTLAFRGLDNASYYRLRDGGRYYVNDTGTGNTLNLAHPMVLRMVMDSLRFWVQDMGIDGFRFDLGTVLGREAAGFDPNAGLLDAMAQDPVLSRAKLIAEPWDIGPGGYQLGNFPHPFAEWNDRFRDGTRRFWRNDAGMAPDLAKRLLGSADLFDHHNRPATASVNFITAHDGFTLADLVQFTVKRNLANGEENRDGHSDNHSDNLGVEGPTDDTTIRAARALRKRNMLATLLLAQGTPMLLAGDEMGNSQDGNNNAYAQDNPTGWVTWDGADDELIRFTTQMIALRRHHPLLRQKRFLHAATRADGMRDVIWRRADGAEPSTTDWHDAGFRCLGLELRFSAAAQNPSPDALYILFNAGREQPVHLPDTSAQWHLILDTTRPDFSSKNPSLSPLVAPAQSVLLFATHP